MARSFLKALKSKKKARSPSEQKDTSSKLGGHRSTPPEPGPSKPVPLPVIGGHRRKSSSHGEQKDRSTAPQIGGHRAKGSSPTGVASISEMQKWNAAKAQGGSERGAPMIGRGRGLGASRGASGRTPTPQPDDEKSPYTASYNYSSVDAIKFSPEDETDSGPYNNTGYGNTSSIKFEEEDKTDTSPYNNTGYGNTSSIKFEEEDKTDTSPYNNTGYGVVEIKTDLADRVEDEVKDSVDAQQSDAPQQQTKASKAGPPKDTPAVRKHRAWLVAKLGKQYKEERSSQRKDLIGAVGESGTEIAWYYAAIRELEQLGGSDIGAAKGLFSKFPDGHAFRKFPDIPTALETVRKAYGDLLEKARREDLPIAEDGTVGDLTSRMVAYDDEAAQDRSLVLVGGKKLFRNDEKKTPVDTKDGVTHFTGVGAEIFVVGDQGEIHMASHKIGKFHHSSLLGGKPVAMAGELKVTNGRIDWISNKSGHYKPTVLQLQQFLYHLAKDGVALDFAVMGMNVPEGTTAQQVVDGVGVDGSKKEQFGHDHRKTQELLLAWKDELGKAEWKKVIEDNGWSIDKWDDEYEVEDKLTKKPVTGQQVRRAFKTAYPDLTPRGVNAH